MLGSGLRFVGIFGLLAGALSLAGCAEDEPADTGGGGTSSSPPASAGETGAGGSSPPSHLVVVSERESPEASLQYLHVLDAWPQDGKLDYKAAIELGEFVNVHAMGDAVFVHQPVDATVRKLVVRADGTVDVDVTISFADYGVAGYAGDMIYVSATRAFLLDEDAGQLVAWNPEAMEISGATKLPEQALSRDGLAAQISRGIALGGQAFVAASFRDWTTLSYYDAAAVGIFDATADEPQLRIIEDDRCASTVASPFDGEDGFAYVVSDAALGFDALANPTQTRKALCVLRIEPGAGEFDPDFFVDLKQALNSPGFYAAHPMKDGKLLVNVWASDVPLETVADPNDSGWYWDYPPYFEYAIVDLASGTSTPINDVPRAAVQWSITLRVDGDVYVQTYRDDTGSDLQRVDPDGTVTRVLSNPAHTDVQYLGRVGG
jgi:hypothetical protein